MLNLLNPTPSCPIHKLHTTINVVGKPHTNCESHCHRWNLLSQRRCFDDLLECVHNLITSVGRYRKENTWMSDTLRYIEVVFEFVVDVKIKPKRLTNRLIKMINIVLVVFSRKNLIFIPGWDVTKLLFNQNKMDGQASKILRNKWLVHQPKYYGS